MADDVSRADRYVVVGQEEAAEKYGNEDAMDYEEGVRFLYDTERGVCVGTDGGEPEDQTFVRDWRWVAVELNRLARETAATNG